MTRRVASIEPMTLPPTRGEKRFIPVSIDVTQLAFEGRSKGRMAGMTKDLGAEDFVQTQAIGTAELAAGFTDFIYVKLLDRGPDGSDLVFKFLINPDSISANRQVIDGEALTRAGLQTGVWGDLLDISVSGVTAGQYFSGGLVDGHSEYSLSERNLLELVAVYENNGNWFEGEGDPTWSADDIARKQLGTHADVTLVFGNFIWSGCFTDLTVDETADTPFYNKFSFNFMAWKERFRDDSPWRNSIRNEQYFGHAYELYRARKKNPDLDPGDGDAASNNRVLFESPASPDGIDPINVPAYQRKML